LKVQRKVLFHFKYQIDYRSIQIVFLPSDNASNEITA